MIKLGIALFIAFVLAYLFLSEEGHEKHNEKYYQTLLCERLDGVMEKSLPDRTRVDCLTTEYAIEVDFAKKWAESIGQSLYYAKMTNRQPAIGLILDADKDRRYLKRLNLVAKAQKIKVFEIKK